MTHSGSVTLLLALATSLLAAMGCGARERPRVELADGTLSTAMPKELRDVGGGVLTEVRTISAGAAGRRERDCIRSSGTNLPPRRLLVERVDVRGTSVTFRLTGRHFVYGCMTSAGARAHVVSWCGHVLGELRGGRLRDPRLDISCRSSDGAAWGSAWVDPVPGSKWIVIRERRYAQIYPTAGGLPVRVTTSTVDLTTATALFKVEQYDRTGTRVSQDRITAAVAG